MVPLKLRGLYTGSHSSSGEGQSLYPPLPQHLCLLCLLQLHPHSSTGTPVTPSCPGHLAQNWPKPQQRTCWQGGADGASLEALDVLTAAPHTTPVTCGFRVAHLAPGLVPATGSSLTGSWVCYNPLSSMWALQENTPSVQLWNKPSSA